jgi:calcium-independent phospholipase A2-gamma
MLGRLEMNIDDCIEAFTGMMDAIFQQKHKLPFKLFSGQVQPRFDSEILEKCIKVVIKKAGFDSEAKLRETKDSRCKVCVLST